MDAKCSYLARVDVLDAHRQASLNLWAVHGDRVKFAYVWISVLTTFSSIAYASTFADSLQLSDHRKTLGRIGLFGISAPTEAGQFLMTGCAAARGADSACSGLRGEWLGNVFGNCQDSLVGGN